MRHHLRRILCLALAAVMMATNPWVTALRCQAVGAAEREGPIDITYVTPGAVAAAAACPRRVLRSPEAEILPIEVFSALGKRDLGIDPLDVERVMVIIEPPGAAPPAFGAVVFFARPYRLDQIMKPLAASTVEAELGGVPYLQAARPEALSLYMPDDQTLLVAHDPLLRKMLANRKNPADGPLRRLLAATDTTGDFVVTAVMDPVRDLLKAQLAAAPLPPPLEPARRIPDLIAAVKVQADLAGQPAASLKLLAVDEPAAEELERIINQLLDLAHQMATAQMAQEIGSDDPVEQAMLQYVQRINRLILDAIRPTRRGKVVTFSSEGGTSMQVATIGVLVALLLPAVQAAREAARRAQSSNNLKQIALAMHMYHEAHRRFPARATFDPDGKPLLSWRVHLLPYLEEQALYDQFHLDEPWDSPHNRQLIPLMPEVYRNPSSDAEPGKADYLVPVGEGTLFEGTEGRAIRDVRDGSSNTVMVLEVDPERAVTWTQPEDWLFDPRNPLDGLGRAHPGGFLAALADGAVRFFSATTNPNTLRALMTIAGEEVVRF